MNHAKHPKFIKDLNHLSLYNRDCPVTEAIREAFISAGFVVRPETPIYTNDGDRVRLIAIDCGHSYPFVGEVIDFGAETSWLARWSATGVYASSCACAVLKHSLKPTDPAGSSFLDPAEHLDCVTNGSPTIAEYERAHGEDKVADADEQPQPPLVFRRYVPNPPGHLGARYRAVDTLLPPDFKAEDIRMNLTRFEPPQPHDRGYPKAGSGGRVREETASDAEASHAEAQRGSADKLIERARVVREPFESLLKVTPGIDTDAAVRESAYEIIEWWTQDHLRDPHLCQQSARHVNFDIAETVIANALARRTITDQTATVLRASLYCIAGRFLISADPRTVLPDTLAYSVRLLKAHLDYPRIHLTGLSSLKKAA